MLWCVCEWYLHCLLVLIQCWEVMYVEGCRMIAQRVITTLKKYAYPFLWGAATMLTCRCVPWSSCWVSDCALSSCWAPPPLLLAASGTPPADSDSPPVPPSHSLAPSPVSLLLITAAVHDPEPSAALTASSPGGVLNVQSRGWLVNEPQPLCEWSDLKLART